MKLGALSISLNVKDIAKSKAFYETLGFTEFAGNIEHKFLIMKNGDHIIGLFESMLEKNTITFNPGWDQNAKEVNPFDDVREIHKNVQAANLPISQQTGLDNDSGPASFVVTDPDGNPILFDQHR